jgi:predicted membrane protein
MVRQRDLMIEKTLKTASWLIILGLVILTIVPADERPVSGLEHDWEHFVAFGLAGLTFGLAYAGHLGARCLSAVVFTLLLELSQIPLATRHARVEDFFVDAAGACLGIVVAHAFRKLTKNGAAAALPDILSSECLTVPKAQRTHSSQ